MKYLILIFLFSCTSYKDLKDRHLLKGSCENEFAKADLPAGQQIWLNTKEATQTSASYLITGLGYSSDFLVSFTSGVVSSLAVCSPLIAIELAGNSNGNASGHCVGEVGVAVYDAVSMELGSKSKKSTERWRCPDLEPVADGLLQVASCYEKKRETKLSLDQLHSVADSEVFVRCLSDSKKSVVQDRIRRLSSLPL
jgi:hypothetical protein